MPSNILVLLSGSIAAYKGCDVISRLVQRGHRVRTVATASALQFVGPSTLEGLTGEPVATDLFAPGAALDHIELARWADLILLCPATANTLNRAAAGLADDLPGTLLLARESRQPLLIAPAMNPAMWTHPATRAAVERLQSWGATFIDVGAGRTACGEVGAGRLAEPAEIVAAVEAALQPRGPSLRVLVTSGGTAEPIDGVRVLTNLSTGHTGALIAATFAAAGHQVTLARGRLAERGPDGVEEQVFTSFADLDALLTAQLGGREFDVVIHAAAVGDFAVEFADLPPGGSRPTGKIDSNESRLLRLKPQPKLIDTLRSRSRQPGLRMVAFKLTDHAATDEIDREIEKLRQRAQPDFIVHNDLRDQRPGADFPATIHAANGARTVCRSRRELALTLERLLQPSPDET
jgi:phosphopantothenoylcysteine decarboxylase/phosphopantothenate--cysteine ligase